MPGLTRRTALVRKTPMPRGTVSLRRTPMPRTSTRRHQAKDIPDAVRRRVLARDGHACVRCGRSVLALRYSLHHRKPRGQGGEHTPVNLITVCGWGGDTAMCHGWIESYRDEARELGFLVPRSTDPATVQVQTWQHGMAWPGGTWIPAT